jgi:acyl carrier protein
VHKRVFEIVAQIMEVSFDDVSENSSPDTLEKWDSLRHIKLILMIEELYGIQFTDSEIVSIQNVHNLIEIIDNREV